MHTANRKPIFNATLHQPPRIDQFGFNMDKKAKMGHDGSNILKDPSILIPTWWEGQNSPTKTLTELKDNRRKAKVPDISYDLNGDGNVSNREYLIAKLFDTNQDGRLSNSERKVAMEAVANVSIFTNLRVSRTGLFGMLNKLARRDNSESCRREVFVSMLKISAK